MCTVVHVHVVCAILSVNICNRDPHGQYYSLFYVLCSNWGFLITDSIIQ